MEKVRVGIGTVDGRVAANTLATSLETPTPMRHVSGKRVHMALQTQEASFATQQHIARYRSMRAVTCGATFNLHRCVLKYKRSALFHVAGNAAFPVCFSQQGPVERPVGVMAVCAFHQTFWNAVMRGQRKLGLDGAVAAAAKLGLTLSKQALAKPALFFGQARHCKEMSL